jgi:hypothetical protein
VAGFALGVQVPLPTLPVGWETTVVVIVLQSQSLVELFAMAFHLW